MVTALRGEIFGAHVHQAHSALLDSSILGLLVLIPYRTSYIASPLKWLRFFWFFKAQIRHRCMCEVIGGRNFSRLFDS